MNAHYSEPSDYAELYSNHHDYNPKHSDPEHLGIRDHPHTQDEYYNYHVDKEPEVPSAPFHVHKTHDSQDDIYTTLSVEFSPLSSNDPARDGKREFSYLHKDHSPKLKVNYEAAREASKYSPPIADLYSSFPNPGRSPKTEKARDFSTLRELSQGPVKDSIFGPLREPLYEAPYTPPLREEYVNPRKPYSEAPMNSYGIHDHSKELELEELSYSPPRISSMYSPPKNVISSPFEKYNVPSTLNPRGKPHEISFDEGPIHGPPRSSLYKSESPHNSEVIYPSLDGPPRGSKYSAPPREISFPSDNRPFGLSPSYHSAPSEPRYTDAHARTPSFGPPRDSPPRFAPHERPSPVKHFEKTHRSDNGPPKFSIDTYYSHSEAPRMSHGPPSGGHHHRMPEPNNNRREFNERPPYEYRQGPPSSPYFRDQEYQMTQSRDNLYSNPLKTALVAPPKSIKDVLLTKRMGIWPGNIEYKRNQRANNALLLQRYTLSMLDNHNPPIIDLGFK